MPPDPVHIMQRVLRVKKLPAINEKTLSAGSVSERVQWTRLWKCYLPCVEIIAQKGGLQSVYLSKVRNARLRLFCSALHPGSGL